MTARPAQAARRRARWALAGWTALALCGAAGIGLMFALFLAQTAAQAGWWTP